MWNTPLFATLVCCLLMVLCRHSLAGESRAVLEGTLDSVRPIGGSGLALELLSGTNRTVVNVDNCGGNSPGLSSRVRAPDANVSGLEQLQLLSGLVLPLTRDAGGLRRMGEGGQHLVCLACLDGQVLAASRNGRFLALQDGTGVVLLQLPPQEKAVMPGSRIQIQGNCVVEGPRAIFCSLPTVDNNDIHGMLEKSGPVYLTPGRHALRLDWFNREAPYGLEVYYEGPGVIRQKIPDSALFRQTTNATTGMTVWTNGLSFRCYEGGWIRMPDFEKLVPAKEGTTANFDLGILSRENDVGLEFAGYLEVPREGLYKLSTSSDDGSLVFVDEQAISVKISATNELPAPAILSPWQSLPNGQAPAWSQVEGVVKFASAKAGDLYLDLAADTGRMRVEIADGSGAAAQPLVNSRVRVAGICLPGIATGGQLVAATLLTPGVDQIEFWESGSGKWSSFMHATNSVPMAVEEASSTNLPTLTRVEEIKRLTREQWEQGYPVKIRGVITTVLDGGMFVEDSTWSIYARWHAPTDFDAPRVGDYYEIEGKTFAEFAPNIQVTRAQRLGAGALPEPLRPAWDQLINGSLDTEYIETQGIVTTVSPGGMTLLTRAGTLGLDLIDLEPQLLPQYDDALVRVRGCVIPVRDNRTQQVEPGRIRLSNASISLEEPAPKDPFDTPLKHASDLLLFDWRAGAFQRVKISGQVLHEENGEYFLADGTNGLRFIPKGPEDLHPGDVVEAVGLVELGGPSAVLREAVARRTGTRALPPAKLLSPDELLNAGNDAMLVTLDARLVQISRNRSGYALEMQAGTRNFVTRLKEQDGTLPAYGPGSLLRLTGVYAGQVGPIASGQGVTSFELLLNSAGDVKLLASPSWWTVRRALAVLTAMILILLIGLVWIALLRRQVEERSQQLAVEIRSHEHTERQREMEEERSRIARDLHDDLGAALTQIRFLSALESRDSRAPETTRDRMARVSEKSNEMVASLDEIVWAINPANDSAASLATYLCHFAEEFFKATPVRCRLDVADPLPPEPMTSEVRHHVYLAVREALNNIAKHSKATETWLCITAGEGELRVTVEDNGRGFSPHTANGHGQGLANMEQRMKRVGGRFGCESRAGAGTVCRFTIPLETPGVEKMNGATQKSGSYGPCY
jgi:signal transduction histidine kinase